MKLGAWVLGITFVLVAAAGVVGIYFLRQAAAENARVRALALAESDCAAKIPSAIELVTMRDSMLGARIQVTASADHYNRQLKQCIVEIATFEHQEAPVYVRTLVSPADNSAILWSFTGEGEGAVRNCYGGDSKLLDCAEADKRWKKLMSE